jgi:hypothetical protein
MFSANLGLQVAESAGDIGIYRRLKTAQNSRFPVPEVLLANPDSARLLPVFA